MKKAFKLLITIICLMINVNLINASGVYKDGWHYVKLVDNPSDTCWAYYKNGVEKIRVSTIFYAHRGWGTAPENSLAAFKETKANGYYAFELDVRFTKDNIPVLLHDATINRVARNSDLSEIKDKLYVKDLTLSELNKYSFSVTRTGEVLKKYKTNKITKFEDVLKYAKENGLTIAIELKAGSKEQIASLVKLVKKYNMDNVTKWISFQKDLLLYVNAADDDEIVGIITNGQSADELKKIRNELKTKNNTVIGLDIKGHNNTPNVPENASSYVQSKYVLKTIPRAVISLKNSELNLSVNESKKETYTYNGDGKISCVSADKNYVTCSIDEKTKTLIIKALKSSSKSIKVTLKGDQGINYSAAASKEILVNIDKVKVYLSLTNSKVNYTGEKLNIKATAKLANGQKYTKKINYNYYNSNNCSGSKIGYQPTNVGNYSVQAYVAASSEYKESKSNCATLTILKVNSVLVVDNKNVTIDEIANINYEYVGDGNLNCTSDNPNITCTIDETTKKLTISSTSSATGVVTLEASEGENYTENKVIINVKSETKSILDNDYLIYIGAGLLIIILFALIIGKIKKN